MKPAPTLLLTPHLSLRLRILAYPLKIFFRLLYHEMAWSYDWVAGIVSLGLWNQWVLSVRPYLKPGRVLELGHGPGHLQAALLRDSISSFGLDRSPQMGRQAQHRLRRAGLNPALINGLAQAMPFPANTFDQVVATFPSEYILEISTIQEIYRVLKPDGCAVILLFAWITGHSLPEKAAAWLFRFTGESPDWDERALAPLRQQGFESHAIQVPLKSSRLLLIEAHKIKSGLTCPPLLQEV